MQLCSNSTVFESNNNNYAPITCRYVEIFHRDEWRVLCDPNSRWRLQEANVACRQLGYEDGAAHFDHGNNTRLGDLRHLLSVNHEIMAVEEVECRGEEANLDACSWRMSGDRCDPRRYAVALVCERPSTALCPGKMEPFRCDFITAVAAVVIVAIVVVVAAAAAAAAAAATFVSVSVVVDVVASVLLLLLLYL